MNYINDLFVKCSGNSDKLKKSIHKRLGKGERIKFASAVRKLESVFKTESTKSVTKPWLSKLLQGYISRFFIHFKKYILLKFFYKLLAKFTTIFA